MVLFLPIRIIDITMSISGRFGLISLPYNARTHYPHCLITCLQITLNSLSITAYHVVLFFANCLVCLRNYRSQTYWVLFLANEYHKVCAKRHSCVITWL